MDRNSGKAWLYLLPSLILLGAFLVYPLIDVFVYSFEECFNFASQTYEGIGCMVGAGIVIYLIACVIMERRTRKLFVDRPKSKDEWSLFDDDDEDEENSKE